MISNDYATDLCDPVHTLQPFCPSLAIHPREHHSPLTNRLFRIIPLPPPRTDFLDLFDHVVSLLSLGGHGSQNNKRLAGRVHDFLEGTVA